MKAPLLLDTNGYSALMRGNEQVLDTVSRAKRLFMSVIVLGELYAGFNAGAKAKQNRRILVKFLQKSTVRILPLNGQSAEIFGDLKQKLKEAGTPVPINDLWIGAQAVENGAKIVTFDRHFLQIPGVRVWDELE